MSRTAYLVETGARTRWANIFTGLTTLVIVLTFVDLAERVPLAVVAGLLMVLGYTAIDLGRLKLVWQINSAERLTMLVTAIFTIVLSPPIAILAGIFLSFASFIRTSASSIDVIYLARGLYRTASHPTRQPCCACTDISSSQTSRQSRIGWSHWCKRRMPRSCSVCAATHRWVAPA